MTYVEPTTRADLDDESRALLAEAAALLPLGVGEYDDLRRRINNQLARLDGTR